MKGDLSESTGRESAFLTLINNQYLRFNSILFFSLQKSYKVLLLDFDPEQTKVNESALEKMVRIREKSVRFFMVASREKFQWY